MGRPGISVNRKAVQKGKTIRRWTKSIRLPGDGLDGYEKRAPLQIVSGGRLLRLVDDLDDLTLHFFGDRLEDPGAQED